MSCSTVYRSANIPSFDGKALSQPQQSQGGAHLHICPGCEQGVEGRNQFAMLSASSRVPKSSSAIFCVSANNSASVIGTRTSTATTARPAIRSLQATFVAHPLRSTGAAKGKSRTAPLHRKVHRLVPVCGAAEDGIGLLVKTGQRIQELVPLMLFTVRFCMSSLNSLQ